MTASFIQVREVSYSWLGHSMMGVTVRSIGKISMFCSHCSVKMHSAMSFCMRCGGMARRDAHLHLALSGGAMASGGIAHVDTAWRARMGMAAGACVIALAGAVAAYQCIKLWDWNQETQVEATRVNTEERGIVDSFSQQLPVSMTTVAGELTRMTNPDGTRHVALNGKALSHGLDANWQFPARIFDLADGRQAVLMASSGGRGYQCETRFYFLVADRHGVQPTPLFGTCAPRITFRRTGDAITLLFPRIGGLSTVEFDGKALTEDGVALVLNDTNHPFN